MPKRRKTRQEKIILQLKRELAKKNRPSVSSNTKKKPRQEAISKQPQIETERTKLSKRIDNSVFSYDPKLIRHDLFKTLILSLIALSLELVLYWRLR